MTTTTTPRTCRDCGVQAERLSIRLGLCPECSLRRSRESLERARARMAEIRRERATRNP